MGLNALGHHILAEMYGCEAYILNDRHLIEKLMVESALEAGAEVREMTFHKFSPQGVSGVVVISESHLAIHTWPEHGYASVDIYTCGDKVNPKDACDYLFKHFKAKECKTIEIERGLLDRPINDSIQIIDGSSKRNYSIGSNIPSKSRNQLNRITNKIYYNYRGKSSAKLITCEQIKGV